MVSESSRTRPARERILDAAAVVMRRDGLVHATTKLIALEADCSEGLLYKHFPDKRDIFLSVLAERSTGLSFDPERAGTSTIRENLIDLTVSLMSFYRENFPMAASIFGSSGLLAGHRAAMDQRGVGPHAPSEAVRRYLEAEGQAGRLDVSATDTDALSRMLTGAALHEAFLAAYAGQPIEGPDEIASRLVDGLGL